MLGNIHKLTKIQNYYICSLIFHDEYEVGIFSEIGSGFFTSAYYMYSFYNTKSGQIKSFKIGGYANVYKSWDLNEINFMIIKKPKKQ